METLLGETQISECQIFLPSHIDSQNLFHLTSSSDQLPTQQIAAFVPLEINMSEFKEDDGGLRREETHESVLERVRSAGLLTISPEMFEKLYLNPKTTVKGDLRSTFGNPTPL